VTLLDDLKRLVEPATFGDSTRPLWVSKSLDKLASALVVKGYDAGPHTARASCSPRSAFHGKSTAKPFEYINEVLAAQAAGQPVISVDTKKKELVGNYRNAGSTSSRPQRQRRVRGSTRKVSRSATPR